MSPLTAVTLIAQSAEGAHLPSGESLHPLQQGRHHLRTSELGRQPQLLVGGGPVSEPHTLGEPEQLAAHWYVTCSCGWKGGDWVWKSSAETAVCPRLKAEREVAADLLKYKRAVAVVEAGARY